MQCIKLNKNALSQVFSVLLTLLIVIGTVAAIFLWGMPAIENNKFKNSHLSALGSYDQMYNIMSSLIIDGSDAKGTANIINNNERGSLVVDPNDGSKLVVSYCYDWAHRFDVGNDLVGGDPSSFSLTMNGGKPCTSATVHWLEPGERITAVETETLPPKKIYDTYMCAQSFIAPDPAKVGNLDKVMLDISKRTATGGDLGDLLSVKIYIDSDSDDLPDGAPITSGVIPKDTILSTSTWVECDLPDVGLASDKEYFIVLETTGGSSAEGSYDYYKWSQTKLYPYDDSDNALTYTDADGWVVDSNSGEYKFPFRTQYTGNSPPILEPLDVTPDDFDVYSGVLKKYSISATDDDGVYYKFYWGDGTDSGWVEHSLGRPYDSHEICTESHIWKEPGTYTMTIQIKDGFSLDRMDYGNVYYDVTEGKDGDYKKQITVQEGYKWPKDSVDYETVTYLDGGFTTVDKDLDGTLKIDLFDGEWRPVDYNGKRGEIPFGTIWVFELGSIILTSSNTVGESQQIIFKNGAILSLGTLRNGFKSEPSFFEDLDADPNIIAFRVFQIGGPGLSTGSTGTYQLSLTMKNNFVRDSGLVYDFEIEFHETKDRSTETDLWKKYFETNYEFEIIPGDPPTIKYKDPVPPDPPDGRILIFDSSYIDVQLQGVR
jgi:hypothetical protein